MRQIINASIKNHPQVARSAMIYELAEFGLKRFGVEQFYAWLDQWMIPYDKGALLVADIYEQIRAHGVSVPKDRIITCAREMASMFAFRTMGNMLIHFKLDKDESLSTEEMHRWAITSSTMGGHDITRTFGMLIMRIALGKKYVRVHALRAIAEILCAVRYDRRSPDNKSTAEVLIHMAYHAFLYRPYKRLMVEYRKALSLRHAEMRTEMDEELSFGEWPAPPRNQRPR
jgi:hypothetical protein